MFKRNPEITQESMEKFMQAHGDFAMSISKWLFTRAEEKDFFAINHFIEACAIIMTEAAKRIENPENLTETKWWN
jgi:hypothetical protein